MVMRYYLCPLTCKSWWEYCYLYLAWTREDIYIWPAENQRSKGFNFYTTSPINWGMGRAATLQSSIGDLLLNEKRDSHTANDRVDIFPLELCLYFHLSLCMSLLIFSQNIQAWMVQRFIDIFYTQIFFILLYLVVNFWITIKRLFYSNYTVTIIQNKSFIGLSNQEI